MSDIIGNYRNEIPELDSISLNSYERIFKVFKVVVDDKLFYNYNILKKIELPEIGEEFLGFYTTKSKMPMTIISHRVYGDLESWWIIYLLNKELFNGDAPFYVDGGVTLKYVKEPFRSLLYQDITNSTIFGNRHY